MKKAIAVIAFALALEGALVLQLALPVPASRATDGSVEVVQSRAARPARS